MNNDFSFDKLTTTPEFEEEIGQSRLHRRAVIKWLEIEEIILKEYYQFKKEFFELDQKFESAFDSVINSEAAVQMNVLRPIIDEKNNKLNRLAFFYSDFFIHTGILLDFIAQAISKGKIDSWFNLLKYCKNSQCDIPAKKAIIEFNKYADNIRFWRHKFFVHGEIAHLFKGTIRHNREKNKIEFFIQEWQHQPGDEIIKKLITIRDKYKSNFHELQRENNFWEILRLFKELPIAVEETDKEVIKEIIKKYGSILPKIEEFIPQLKQFLRILNIIN